MKTTTMTASSLTAALLTLGSLVGRADAALVITWLEDGPDVVATSSGSLEAPSTFALQDTARSISSQVYNGGAYIGEETTLLDIWTGSIDGSFDASFARPTSLLGGEGFFVGFGSIVNGITVDSSYEFGDELESTSTWATTTLDDLSLSADDNMTVTYITATGTDSITLRVVPEPTSALLCGLGFFGFLFKRKRF